MCTVESRVLAHEMNSSDDRMFFNLPSTVWAVYGQGAQGISDSRARLIIILEGRPKRKGEKKKIVLAVVDKCPRNNKYYPVLRLSLV
jgi:hypothetical protein